VEGELKLAPPTERDISSISTNKDIGCDSLLSEMIGREWP
jgi:hypothetical protein